MVKRECICPHKPDCLYPHIYALGTPQDLTKNRESEGRDCYLVDITGLTVIIPADYFKTTGDLQPKLKALLKDVYGLEGAIKKILHLAALTQGKSEFMETTRDEEGRVIAVPKTTKAERARRGGKPVKPRGARYHGTVEPTH